MKTKDLLIAVRRQCGWTQERMARFFKVTRVTVWDWEQGKREPPEAVRKVLSVMYSED